MNEQSCCHKSSLLLAILLNLCHILLQFDCLSLKNSDYSKSDPKMATEIEQGHVQDDSVQDTRIIESSKAPIFHPLEQKWSIFYVKPDKNAAYNDCIHNVCTFDTVEDFWCVFNHLISPSELTINNDLALFRSPIVPVWEHPDNKTGGRLYIQFRKNQPDMLDNTWRETVLALIGAMIGHERQYINGVIASSRRMFLKINIWISTLNTDAIKSIAEQLRAFLSVHDKFAFERHSDSATKKGSLNSDHKNLF